jgi:hypothetical protein
MADLVILGKSARHDHEILVEPNRLDHAVGIASVFCINSHLGKISLPDLRRPRMEKEIAREGNEEVPTKVKAQKNPARLGACVGNRFSGD